MPEYELRLRFTAADAYQAVRLAGAWADTCAAEYGTRHAGLAAVEGPPHCDWCGTALFPDFEGNWHDRHGDFRCPEVSEDHTDHLHEPAPSTPTPPVQSADNSARSGEEMVSDG